LLSVRSLPHGRCGLWGPGKVGSPNGIKFSGWLLWSLSSSVSGTVSDSVSIGDVGYCGVGDLSVIGDGTCEVLRWTLGLLDDGVGIVPRGAFLEVFICFELEGMDGVGTVPRWAFLEVFICFELEGMGGVAPWLLHDGEGVPTHGVVYLVVLLCSTLVGMVGTLPFSLPPDPLGLPFGLPIPDI